MSVTGAYSFRTSVQNLFHKPPHLIRTVCDVFNLIKIHVFQIFSTSLIIKLIVLSNSYYLELIFYFRHSSSSNGKCYIMIAYSTVNNTIFEDTCRFICLFVYLFICLFVYLFICLFVYLFICLFVYCMISITSSSNWLINQLRKVVSSINSAYVFKTILCRFKRITIFVSDCDASPVFIFKSVELVVNKIKDLNRYSRGGG